MRRKVIRGILGGGSCTSAILAYPTAISRFQIDIGEALAIDY